VHVSFTSFLRVCHPITVHRITGRNQQYFLYVDVLTHTVMCTYLCKIFRCDFDAEQFAESSIPILVVGTKLDQVPTASDESSQRSFSIAEECGADEVNLVIDLNFLFSYKSK